MGRKEQCVSMPFVVILPRQLWQPMPDCARNNGSTVLVIASRFAAPIRPEGSPPIRTTGG
eukprot:382618-Rhodomonas_salina.1